MKKLICNRVGGPEECNHTIMVETETEAFEKWMPHWQEAHKDLIENSTEEDKKEWFEKHHQVWETTPDELGEDEF